MGEQKDRHKKSPNEGKDHAKSFTEGNRENEGAKTLYPCFPSVENETSVEINWRKNPFFYPKGITQQSPGLERIAPALGQHPPHKTNNPIAGCGNGRTKGSS